MTVPTIKVKVVRRPQIKVKTLVKFPANVVTQNFLTVTNSGGTYTFSVDYSLLGPGPVIDPTTAFMAVQDQTAGIYRTISLSSFLTSGLDADLQAIAALSGAGILVRTASNTWALRTDTGTANEITVINGDGVAGNPTFSLPTALTFTGKTITGGTYSGAVSYNKLVITAPATTATLTIANNKSLSVSNILTLAGTDSTTITFQGTDTYVGRATTDVLTNKSISGATNTLSAIANGSLTNSTITIGGVATSLGGTLTAAIGRGSTALNIDQLTPKGDTNYTILSTDRCVFTNAAFTASRTWTLPAANSVNAGQSILIADLQGTVTSSNTLVVSRAGADTINGTTSVSLTTASTSVQVVSDGTSKWYAVTSSSGGGGGGSSFAQYEYTATAAQTTFSGADINAATLAYTAPFVLVYVNGDLLNKADYTATNGSSVVLAARTLNDQVKIVAMNQSATALLPSNNLSDVVSAATSRTNLGITPANIGAAPAITTITNSIGADVTLSNTGLYFTGPTVAQGTSGTWFASGTVSCVGPASDAFWVKLWDGTTVIASAASVNPQAANYTTITLSGVITNPAGNIRMDVRDANNTTGKILFNSSGNSKDSTLTAIRIA